MDDRQGLVVFIAILAGLAVLLGLHALARRRAIARFGSPLIPADIEELHAHLGQRIFTVLAADFTLVKRRKRRALLERAYPQADGIWTLAIELEDERVVAFEARFRSNRSWLLNEIRHRYRERSIFLE